MIKNSPGCTRDFRLAMWGTSSPGEKLAGDLGSPIEATPIEGRRSNRPVAGKSPPANFGLLQQNLPTPDLCKCNKLRVYLFPARKCHEAFPIWHWDLRQCMCVDRLPLADDAIKLQQIGNNGIYLVIGQSLR